MSAIKWVRLRPDDEIVLKDGTIVRVGIIMNAELERAISYGELGRKSCK